MFSGIVRDVGRIVSIDSDTLLAQTCDWRIRIATRLEPARCVLGASICCNGICLTVAELHTRSSPHQFTVQAGATTRACTTLPSWEVGDALNLENSLSLGDSVDGHLVTGHVDGRVRLARRRERENEIELFFQLLPTSHLLGLIVERGSVALDGVSLTVASMATSEVDGMCEFSVAIVPYTARHTTLGNLADGDWANIEVDILARYVARHADFHIGGRTRVR